MSEPTPGAPPATAGDSDPREHCAPPEHPAPQGHPTPQEDPARREVLARQEATLRRFALLLHVAGVILIALGVGLGGLDFAMGVLLGFLIVLLNFYWTKKAVKSVLFASQPKGLLTLSFLVKFGVTGAVLFYAILRLNVDALGVLVGLSTLLIASLLFALQLGFTRRQGPGSP